MNQRPKDYESDAAWEGCYKSTTCDACRIASQASPGTIPAQSRRTRHKLGTRAQMVLPHSRVRSIVDRPLEPRGAGRTNAFVLQLPRNPAAKPSWRPSAQHQVRCHSRRRFGVTGHQAELNLRNLAEIRIPANYSRPEVIALHQDATDYCLANDLTLNGAF